MIIPPVPSRALRAMRDQGGFWAAYQNSDLSSPDYQSLKFLRVGKGCAFGDNDTDPPLSFPDPLTRHGRDYPYVGMVGLKTGTVLTDRQLTARSRTPIKETPGMDPNANLEEIRGLIMDLSDLSNEEDVDRDMDALNQLIALVSALDDWISGGGFLPKAWRGEQTSKPE